MKGKTLTELYHEIEGPGPSGEGTDKHNFHRYDGLYGPLLAHKRETAKKVLEIGVSWLGSGDLEALGHYFPNAEVHGIDINPLERVKEEYQADNVVFHHMDGYNVANLDESFGDTKWDFVLDDGPHDYPSQLHTLNYFHDKLAPNGILLIEDIQGGISGGAVNGLYENFEGDKHFLSFIDRTRGAQRDDIIAMYMPY